MANKKQIEKARAKIERVSSIKKARLIPKMNLAAIDQATNLGISWQLSGKSKFDFDCWDLSIKSRESQGMKWLRFESRLKSFLEQYKIQVVAYELPAGRNMKPIIHSSKLICIIEKLCSELGIEYIEFSSTEVKRFATNNGLAKKEEMISYAESLWGYNGSNDNEADAIHILHYLKSKVN